MDQKFMKWVLYPIITKELFLFQEKIHQHLSNQNDKITTKKLIYGKKIKRSHT